MDKLQLTCEQLILVVFISNESQQVVRSKGFTNRELINFDSVKANVHLSTPLIYEHETSCERNHALCDVSQRNQASYFQMRMPH